MVPINVGHTRSDGANEGIGFRVFCWSFILVEIDNTGLYCQWNACYFQYQMGPISVGHTRSDGANDGIGFTVFCRSFIQAEHSLQKSNQIIGTIGLN